MARPKKPFRLVTAAPSFGARPTVAQEIGERIRAERRLAGRQLADTHLTRTRERLIRWLAHRTKRLNERREALEIAQRVTPSPERAVEMAKLQLELISQDIDALKLARAKFGDPVDHTERRRLDATKARLDEALGRVGQQVAQLRQLGVAVTEIKAIRQKSFARTPGKLVDESTRQLARLGENKPRRPYSARHIRAGRYTRTTLRRGELKQAKVDYLFARVAKRPELAEPMERARKAYRKSFKKLGKNTAKKKNGQA